MFRLIIAIRANALFLIIPRMSKALIMKNKKIRILVIIAILAFALCYAKTGHFRTNLSMLKVLEGEYRPTDEDLSWMILIIDPNGGMMMSDGIGVPYLTIYDDEAGNPGVEGKIIRLNKDTITIKIAFGYYAFLPDSDWKTTASDSRLEMHYKISNNKLILENNGKEMGFYRINQ